MNLKKRYFIPIIALVLVFVLCMVYFSIFSKFTIVQDTSWKHVMPKGCYRDLRVKLAKKGYRLSVKTFKVSDFSDIDDVVDELEKLDTGGIILVSPVLSSALNLQNIDVKDNLQRTKIIAIGSEDLISLFDVVLVSNTVSGWVDAAAKAFKPEKKAAVIYDEKSLVEGKAVYDALESKDVVKVNKQEYGSLFGTEISKKLEDEGVNLVFCPTVTNMDDLVLSLPSQEWVTDYRFAGVVSKDKLIGVVAPALFSSIEAYLSSSIFDLDLDIGVLNYEFRKVR